MKKRVSWLIAILVLAVGIFTACSSGEVEEPSEPTDVEQQETEEDIETEEDVEEEDVSEEIELSDWEGDWNSITWYLDAEEVQGAYEELAEKRQISAEEAKIEYRKEVETDFNAITIDSDGILYLEKPVEEDGDTIEEVKYDYVTAHPMEHGGQTFYWHEFKADGEADHEIVLLIDVHGEETLPHFHMRYGNDVEELLADDDWYPTMLSPTATMDQVYEEIAE